MTFIQERKQVIHLLLSYGLPPLPVAPRINNAINGKCPSYLDNNKSKLVPHSKYRDALPDAKTIEKWFYDQNVGIGTLGIRDIVFVDIDRKNFDTDADCSEAFTKLIKQNPKLIKAWLEQTHSGGYRIGVRVREIPNFKNFKLSSTDGRHIGEILHSGSFTVLAPTVGVTGNTYKNINRPTQLPIIESVESLGILPVRVEIKAESFGESKEAVQSKSTPIQLSSEPIQLSEVNNAKKPLFLFKCISKNNQAILEGGIKPEDDGSKLFSDACKDLLGWENWLKEQNISFIGNARDIAYEGGRKNGFNDRRISDILKGLTQTYEPALKLRISESACISKVEGLLGIKEFKEFSKEALNEKNWDNWLKSREFKALKQVKLSNFEFPDDTPRHNAIIAVKSGMGTGKTEAMLKMISGNNIGSMIIGYRNNLLFQTIARGSEKLIIISHINEDGSVTEKEEISLSCCINSGYKLSGMFKNRDIYFDEIESVLRHIVDGGTFSNSEQKRAMNIFEEAVRESNRIFLLDGNLTTDTVRYIHQFAPEKTLFTIENTKKIDPHNIFFVDGAELTEDGEFKLKPRSKSHLISHLSDSNSVPFIGTDSKKFAHELQEYLIRSGKVGIVISADTVQERYAKDFLENPNLYIKNHKPGFVIITPSCESGVSITEQYFTAKYTFFCGVLGTSSQHQMMFRLRDNTINHYVYCPDSSLIRDNSIPMGYTGEVIRNALLDRITLSSLMCIQNASFTEAKDIIINALAQMTKDKWFDYSCKLWGLANFERQNLRKCLGHSLDEAGHNISFDQWGINSEIDDTFKEIKKDQLLKEAELQFAAKPFESMEECRKWEGQDVNLETRRRIMKTKLLLETLPGIDKEECYGVELFKRKIKIRGYIGNNQNYSRLVNFEVNQKKMEEDWFFKTTSEQSFIGNLRYTNFTRIAALHDLNILSLVNDTMEFTKNSPELICLFESVNDSKEMLTKLNINKRKSTESRKEVIEMFRQLLAMIGIELGKAVKKLDSNNKRVNHYKIDWDKFNDPIRQAIVRITAAKDSEWLQTHQTIPWVNENSTNLAVIQLKQQFQNTIAQQDYSIYCRAITDLTNTKYQDSPWGRTVEQVEHNLKIDHIIKKAWEQLHLDEQRAILDLRPAGSNFMDVIDKLVQQTHMFSDVHMKSLKTINLWKMRLESAFEIGKNFVNSLTKEFFETYHLGIDDEDVQIYEMYENARGSSII